MTRAYIVAGDYIELVRTGASEEEIAAATARARAVTGQVPTLQFALSEQQFDAMVNRATSEPLRESRTSLGSPPVADLVWRRFAGEIGQVLIEPKVSNAQSYQLMAQPIYHEGQQYIARLLASGTVVVEHVEAGITTLGHWNGARVEGPGAPPIEISYHLALWLTCRVRTAACAVVCDPEDQSIAGFGPFPEDTAYVGFIAGRAAALNAIPVTPIAYRTWGDGLAERRPPGIVSLSWLIERGAEESELLLSIGARRAEVEDPFIAGKPSCMPCLGLSAYRVKLQTYAGPPAPCHRCVAALREPLPNDRIKQ